MFKEKDAINSKYYVFQDKKPYFNPKTCQYSFDFQGRVKESSIKNFQLVPESLKYEGNSKREFSLQFGKFAKDEFILDLQFPFSIF